MIFRGRILLFILGFLVLASLFKWGVLFSPDHKVACSELFSNSRFRFQNVSRDKDGSLFMAYYFAQWHIVPQNSIDGVFYTDWDLFVNGGQCCTPQNFYKLNAEVLEAHDELAFKHQVGVFIFYHYWDSKNGMVMNHGMELFIQVKRKTKLVICWDNEDGFLAKTVYEHPERHAYQLLRFFMNENYLTYADGSKPFVLYLNNVPKSYFEGFANFLKLYGIVVHFLFHYQDYGNKFQIPEWAFGGVEFGPHTHGRYYGMNRQRLSSAFPDYWQGLLVGWDSRPRARQKRSKLYRTNGIVANGLVDVVKFKKNLKWMKSNFALNNVDHVITLFAWNEWSEGAVLECSKEFNCSFIEALGKRTC